MAWCYETFRRAVYLITKDSRKYTICAQTLWRWRVFIHCWYLGAELKKFLIAYSLIQLLGRFLIEGQQKNYKVARGKSLKRIEVKVVLQYFFHDWNGKNKKKALNKLKMETSLWTRKNFADWEQILVQSKVLNRKPNGCASLPRHNFFRGEGNIF